MSSYSEHGRAMADLILAKGRAEGRKAGRFAGLGQVVANAIPTQEQVDEREYRKLRADAAREEAMARAEAARRKVQVERILTESKTPYEAASRLAQYDPESAEKLADHNRKELANRVLQSSEATWADDLVAFEAFGGPQAKANAPQVYPGDAWKRQQLQTVENFLKETAPVAPKETPVDWQEVMEDGKLVKKAVPRVAGTTIEMPPPEAKPDPNPTEASLAVLAAKGDPVAIDALRRMRAQDASQAREARMWVVRDGKTLRVAESEIQPGDMPASTREQGRNVTSGDVNRLSDYASSLQDLKVLRGEVADVANATGPTAQAGAAVPNWVTAWTGIGATAKQKQAVIDRVKQVIGKALEGGVLRKEDEYKYAKILPTIGDVPTVVKSKLDGLDKAIMMKRDELLSSLEDANYDVSRYRQRLDAAPTNDPLGIR